MLLPLALPQWGAQFFPVVVPPPVDTSQLGGGGSVERLLTALSFSRWGMDSQVAIYEIYMGKMPPGG